MPEQITVALPTGLQGQIGAGRGQLRWYFAVNEPVSEAATSMLRFGRSALLHVKHIKWFKFGTLKY